MKPKIRLNEYLYKKLAEDMPSSEKELEEWIRTWYREEYFQLPPIWLVKRERKKRD